MASAANLKPKESLACRSPLARRMLPRVDRREIAAIFAGGALGTLARAALAEAFPHPATPGRIARGYSVIDELTRERGLVTCETISCLDQTGPRAAGPPWR
jgi:hypothetical protein